MFWYNYLLFAICGIHFGDTNEPTYITDNPVSESRLISLVFC